MGHWMALAVRAEPVLALDEASARSVLGVEWPRKGQTPEKRRSWVTCMAVVLDVEVGLLRVVGVVCGGVL